MWPTPKEVVVGTQAEVALTLVEGIQHNAQHTLVLQAPRQDIQNEGLLLGVQLLQKAWERGRGGC